MCRNSTAFLEFRQDKTIMFATGCDFRLHPTLSVTANQLSPISVRPDCGVKRTPVPDQLKIAERERETDT
jgi:hypothetical protein